MRKTVTMFGVAMMATTAFAGTAQAANGNGNQGCPEAFNYRSPGAFFQVIRDRTGQNPKEFSDTAGFDNVGEAIRVICKEN